MSKTKKADSQKRMIQIICLVLAIGLIATAVVSSYFMLLS